MSISRDYATPQGVPPEHVIRSMSHALGDLPEGDVPVAWWSSSHPQVIKGWETYQQARAEWNNGYAALLDECHLPGNCQYMTAAGNHFFAIVPPKGVGSPSRWLRANRDGYWVPRKRTKAEKLSKASALFGKLNYVPTAVDYLPGMPSSLWTGEKVYPVHVRRNTVANAQAAVLAFVGADPDTAEPVFEVSEHWTRMKLSTFHLLREHQEARKARR